MHHEHILETSFLPKTLSSTSALFSRVLVKKEPSWCNEGIESTSPARRLLCLVYLRTKLVVIVHTAAIVTPGGDQANSVGSDVWIANTAAVERIKLSSPAVNWSVCTPDCPSLPVLFS